MMGRDRHQPQPTYRYLLFYKPYNVLCQFTEGKESGFDGRASTSTQPSRAQPNAVSSQEEDNRPETAGEAHRAAVGDSGGRQTLKDYISVPDVYPVGRLDQDSEGLMLLTNDGDLQHRLSHPKFRHPRTYWVQVERLPDAAALQQLRAGVVIQGDRTRPAQVQLLETEPDFPPRDPPIRFRKNVPTAWLEMTLTEGRNRQVRRMTASVGFPTLRLVRVGIVDLRLTDLHPGQWRDLTPQELARVRQVVGKSNVKTVKSWP